MRSRQDSSPAQYASSIISVFCNLNIVRGVVSEFPYIFWSVSNWSEDISTVIDTKYTKQYYQHPFLQNYYLQNIITLIWNNNCKRNINYHKYITYNSIIHFSEYYLVNTVFLLMHPFPNKFFILSTKTFKDAKKK